MPENPPKKDPVKTDGPVSSARSNVAPFIAMDMFRAANELAEEWRGTDKSIVHMELGQPAVPPPDFVLEAAKRSLDSGLIGYTEALGLTMLRERIAQYYQDYYGVSPAED